MKSDSNSSEPFITKTYKPAVTGVLIVAEGAKSSEIKYNIQKAVSKLYDISLEQVNVYPMKEQHIMLYKCMGGIKNDKKTIWDYLYTNGLDSMCGCIINEVK